MKTMKTNKDTCSYMETLELNCFCDSGLARMDWEDNFKTIQHGGMRGGDGIHFFVGYDCKPVPSYVTDCLDLSEVTEKEARAFLVENFDGSIRDCMEWKRFVSDSWLDALEEFLNQMDLIEAIRDGFPAIGNHLFNVVSVTGHSQGDYALVMYEPEPGFLSDESQARQHFENLFYDCQIHCNLSVDGEEYFLSEGLSDSYKWEPEEILAYARKLGLSEKVLEWLEENLPEYPEYL